MRLLRRPAGPDEQAAATARVRGLLPEGISGGWVPPPSHDSPTSADLQAAGRSVEPDPGAPAAAAATISSRAPVTSGQVHDGFVPTESGVGATLPGRHAAPRSSGLRPGLREAGRAGPATEVAEDRDRRVAAGSGLAHGAAEAPAPAARPREPARPSLAERLRQGRLDPGRRGVVGLAVVGVLACLLAGLLALRSAPEELALPAVEQQGRPIAGATLPSARATTDADGTPAGREGSGPEGPGPEGAGPQVAGPEGAGPQVAGPEVVVAVAGRVARPGLVRLTAGSRVHDALQAAGGLLPGASPGLLNLARKVVDGEQVLVGVGPAPAAPAAAAAPGGAAAPPGAAGPGSGALVDLNTATAADLDALPGIGPVLAERILEHRTREGPFRSVDQLREVSGIGEAKYASLRDAVTV